jgi:superfamily I DNA/RNA helicase
MMPALYDRLCLEGIPCLLGEPKHDGFVALVPFQDAKGLEREVVLVAGIEDLYESGKPEGLFWEESQKIKRETLSRRTIYVAMTRTIEQLVIYYQQPNNPFIANLLKINESILAKRG